MSRKQMLAALAALIAVVTTSVVRAVATDPPATIAYRGHLERDGVPVTAAMTLQISLFTAPTGGTAVWTDTFNGVAVNAGEFAVTLGTGVALPASALDAGTLYLAVAVGGVPLNGRQAILATPFTLRAATANNANGDFSVPGQLVVGGAGHGRGQRIAFGGPDSPQGMGMGGPNADEVWISYNYLAGIYKGRNAGNDGNAVLNFDQFGNMYTHGQIVNSDGTGMNGQRYGFYVPNSAQGMGLGPGDHVWLSYNNTMGFYKGRTGDTNGTQVMNFDSGNNVNVNNDLFVAQQASNGRTSAAVGPPSANFVSYTTNLYSTDWVMCPNNGFVKGIKITPNHNGNIVAVNLKCSHD